METLHRIRHAIHFNKKAFWSRFIVLTLAVILILGLFLVFHMPVGADKVIELVVSALGESGAEAAAADAV